MESLALEIPAEDTILDQQLDTLPRSGAPSGRADHTAVWTGGEMIVWGGSDGNFVNTGGRYNPTTNSWTATSTANAPDGRLSHTAVWTGSEMIVWGGYVWHVGDVNTGGRYNPITDNWTVPARSTRPLTEKFTRQSGRAVK